MPMAGTTKRPTGRRRLVVGISGASGAVYAQRLLDLLRLAGIETHLVISRAGGLTVAHELTISPRRLSEIADVTYPATAVGSAIASGSFPILGMVVVPCSMRTLAEIATGAGSNLLTRAADVVLKERRRLVLVTRETPLSAIHLRNMLTVTEAGGIIMPPVPAFYIQPQSIADLVNHTVGRVLDLFGIEADSIERWGQEISLHRPHERPESPDDGRR